MLSTTSFDLARGPLLRAKAEAPDTTVYGYLHKALEYLSLAEDAWLWTQRAPTNAEMERMWQDEVARHSEVLP